MTTSRNHRNALGWTLGAAALVGTVGLAGPASAATIQFDFGVPDETTTGGWNNLAIAESTDGTGTGGTGLRIVDAITSDSAATTVNLNITKDFARSEVSGVNGITGFPDTATSDSFYLNSGSNGGTATIRLEGLSPNGSYDLTFFGGFTSNFARRLGIEIGSTRVVAQNQNRSDGTVTPSPVTIAGALADLNGELVIDFDTDGITSGYLGLMQVEGTFPVPEPGSLALTSSLFCLLLRRKRS